MTASSNRPDPDGLRLSKLFYRSMRLIRVFEETLLRLFDEGRLSGTTHTYIGQEGNAVGVFAHLSKDDVVVSNHRSHGHYLARTDDVEGLIAEIMGKATGVCRGVGGSQHLHNRNFYSNGILGGTVPLAAGIAFAEKLHKSGAVCVACMGDGTFGEGVVYETLNMASLFELPILFLVENNQYAQSTPVSRNTAGTFEDRFKAFGMHAERIKGNDVQLVSEAAGEQVQRIRNSGRPHALVVDTYRLAPHSKGDDLRPREELEMWWAKDPLHVLEGRLPADFVAGIKQECETRIQKAVQNAESAPLATDWQTAAAR